MRHPLLACLMSACLGTQRFLEPRLRACLKDEVETACLDGVSRAGLYGVSKSILTRLVSDGSHHVLCMMAD